VPSYQAKHRAVERPEPRTVSRPAGRQLLWLRGSDWWPAEAQLTRREMPGVVVLGVSGRDWSTHTPSPFPAPPRSRTICNLAEVHMKRRAPQAALPLIEEALRIRLSSLASEDRAYPLAP
jgi:hypothetical protein